MPTVAVTGGWESLGLYNAQVVDMTKLDLIRALHYKADSRQTVYYSEPWYYPEEWA